MQAKEHASIKLNLDNGIIQKLDLNDYKNILVLTGPKNSLNLFRSKIEPLIKKKKIYLYSKIITNPTEARVYEIINFVRDEKIDCIVSVGGGSVIDSAKLASLLLSHGGMLHDYAGGGTLGSMGIASNVVPHIAIPTISGAGTEFLAYSSFVKNSKRHYVCSPYLLPVATYIDPELMTGIPSALWNNVGFETFVHALEAYVSPFATKMSDAYAEEGLRGYVENMPKLLKNPNDTKLIKNIIIATINSISAANLSSAGAISAIGDALSTRMNLHYGIAFAAVAPIVCKYNYDTNKKKYNHVAELLGKRGMKIDKAISEFVKECGIAVQGIKSKLNQETVDALVRDSFNHSMRGNPKFLSIEEVENIIKKIS